MQLSNRDRVGRALDLLVQGIAGPVDIAMRKAFDGQENWNELWASESAQPGRKISTYSKTDAHYLLKAIANPKFSRYFGALLNQHQRAWASELGDIRNLWAHTQPISNDEAARALYLFDQLLQAVNEADLAGAVRKLRVVSQRVQIGTAGEVGGNYQTRTFDEEIHHLWADGGDRRLWLRGGPGLGKSFSARRVFQSATAEQGDTRANLLIWVDSADSSSVIEKFAAAADRLMHEGYAMSALPVDSAERKARALLDVLNTSSWGWLVVLDNADAAGLIEAGLIPSGVNPHGRVLLTTLSRDHRLESHGRVVQATLFSQEESWSYLDTGLHSRAGDHHSSGKGSAIASLAEALGHHPLALSIASATIAAHDLDVSDWLSEFTEAAAMDAAADAADKGGYPHLIGATWRVALHKAAAGFPDGAVERAALVAALQNPDGHPTWIWECDAVARYVAGGKPLERHHGKPVVVQRLIAHGIVDLRGTSWKHGQLSTHILGARAVRELVGSGQTAELAEILAHAWLARITESGAEPTPGDIRRNLAPFVALPDLSETAVNAVKALLAFAAPPRAQVLLWEIESLERIAPYLERGGAIGRAVLADQYMHIGVEEEDIGRLLDARARFTSVIQILEDQVDDESVSDRLRADYLKRLGDAQARAGLGDSAQESYHRAVRIYERLTEVGTRDTKLGAHLMALVELYEKLGNTDRKDALFARSEEVLRHAIADDEADNSQGALIQRGRVAQEQADQLQALGRTVEAQDVLARAVELFERAGLELYHHNALGKLARLHIRLRQWKEAANCLAETSPAQRAPANDLVLLASIQGRLGNVAERASCLARAAESYSAPSTESDKPMTQHDRDIMESASLHVQEMWDVTRSLALDAAGVVALEHERWTDALGLFQGALALAEQRASANPGEHEQSLASAHHTLGTIYFRIDENDAAVKHCGHAVRIREVLADLDPDKVQARTDLASSLLILGAAYRKQDQDHDAVECLRRAIDLYRPLGSTPVDPSSRVALDLGLEYLANAYKALGQADQAIASSRGRVALWQEAAERSPGLRHVESRLAAAYYGLAHLLQNLGRLDDAIEPLTKSIAVSVVLVEHDPADLIEQEALLEYLIAHGVILCQADRTGEGAVVLGEALARSREAVDRDPGDVDAQLRLAQVLSLLGIAYSETDRLAEAADHLLRATSIVTMLADLTPGQHEDFLGQMLRARAEVLQKAQRFQEAEDVSARADEIEGR